MNRLLLSIPIAAVLACAPPGEKAPAASAGGETSLVGKYATDAETSGDKAVTLELKSDSTAVMTVTTQGQQPASSNGKWSADGPNVTVTIGSEAPMEWRLVSNRLVPVQWDRNTYGEAGVNLNRENS